jgi:hypothetical protein
MSRRLAVALAAIAGAFLLVVPSAFGAPVTKTLTFPVNGNSTTNIFDKTFSCCHIVIGDPLDIDTNINGGIALDMKTTSNAATHNDLTFTDTNLRQGKQLDLTNTFTRDSQSLGVDYTLSGHVSVFGFGLDYSKTEGDTLSSCGLPLTTDSCSDNKNITLFSFNPIDIGVAYVQVSFNAVITTSASINSTTNGNGLTSHRTLTTDGIDIKPPTDLNFTSPSQAVDEGVKLSCSLPPNNPVNYAMGDESAKIDGAITEGFGIGVQGDAFIRDIPPAPDIHLATIGPFNIDNLFTLDPLSFTTISVSSAGQNVDLGTLLPNNIPPTVAMDTIPTNGTEGSPIQLSVKGTGPGGTMSPCGDDSLDFHWNFDDGGQAFGKTVNHAWADNFLGSPPHTGQVVITDPTGLKTTLNFSVPVANVPPTVSAGPDKTQYWGLPVAFHGNGADTGPVDNGSLLYAWDFGDPYSTVGGSGQDVSHTYGTPGHYTAMVTITDNDGATGNANVGVTVNKRDSNTAYTGGTTFVVTDAGTLKAELNDSIVAGPISGRTVDFYDGATWIASGVTGTNGVATANYTFPLGSVGPHTITAKFAGDTFYNPSQSAMSVTVNQNATQLAYTGPLTSNPSKALVLTAKLTDDLARALAGKTVNFTLGSQTCNGQLTASTGIVSCTIPKLTQKPGNYTLTSSFAGDADYQPVSVSVTFNLPK